MKRLIFQTWTNLNDTETPAWVQHSSQRAAQYAHRVNADYELFEPIQCRNFHSHFFNKFHAIERVGTYDQVLYLDSDILILPHAENIFDRYAHSGFVGVFQNAADQAQHSDNPSYGPINGGVILYNQQYDLRQCKLNRINITSQFDLGRELNPTLLHSYLGHWWENWDDEFLDEVTYIGHTGLVNDEPLFWRILSLYNIKAFHIHRQFNYDVQRWHEHRDHAQFLHYQRQNAKHLLVEHSEALSA